MVDNNNTEPDFTHIINNTRPNFCISDAGLQEKMEIIFDEMESRGGFENLGILLQNKYNAEMDMIIDEVARRN